jgi:NTE family protein
VRKRARRLLPLLIAAAAVPGAGCAHMPVSCPAVSELVAQGVPAGGATAAPVCPAPVAYPFTNVVFEGGGVKGIAYGGALEVLEQQGILGEIDRVAGTSAGAITAVLVALRYTPAEVKSLLYNLDFSRFEDGRLGGLLRLLRRYGYYKGDYYLGLMRCLVGAKTGNPRATFADLRRLQMRDLHVFTTDLNRRQARELSFDKSPGFEVALAARMSGSFPLFFAAIRQDRDVYVDGGVLRNYPIDAFDSREGTNPATLGFVLENTGMPPAGHPVNDLVQYSEALIESLLAVQTDALATDPPDLERTAVLDDLGVSTLDFHLTAEQKDGLVDKGRQCTCDYLAEWQRWHREGIRPGARQMKPGERVPIVGSGRCGAMMR